MADAQPRITPPGPLPPPIIGTDPASAPGIPQPVIVSGGESLPPSFPLGTAGSWLPPPQVGMGENEPFPTPVVPPGVGPTPTQPWFGSGDAATPALMFPGWTLTVPPSPPIVFANIFNMGNVPPPSTPTTAVIPWTGAITPTADGNGDEDEPETRAAPVSADVPPPKPKRSHHAAKRRTRH